MSAAAGVVIFDLDGTLTDSAPGIFRTLRYAIERLNEARSTKFSLPRDEDLRWVVGPPLRDSVAQIVGAPNVDLFMKYYLERYGSIGLLENSVYAGIIEALTALSEIGCRLFVATSKNEIDARRIVAHFGLARYFHEIYGAQVGGGRADKTELLRYLLGRERIAPDPNRVVMIGDRKFDCEGAGGVGIAMIGALWGYGDAEELKNAGANLTIGAPAQIVAAVGQVFGQSARRSA